MRPQDALPPLRQLEEENDRLGSEPRFLEWQGKCLVVLRAAFGANGHLVADFRDATSLRREGYTVGGGIRDIEAWRHDAANRGKGVLRAAIFSLETLADESLLDDTTIDPELWAHVQGLVADDDWAKVPAAVAIFVEDKIRVWAGDPRQENGTRLVGKGLYGAALADTGILRLGSQPSEWEGWRALGVGLAQACGNVDRHRVQQRPDQKRYAMGVLGLGTLLLTQVRYEQPARVVESEADLGDTAGDSEST